MEMRSCMLAPGDYAVTEGGLGNGTVATWRLHATEKRIQECKGCKVLEFNSSPIAEVAPLPVSYANETWQAVTDEERLRARVEVVDRRDQSQYPRGHQIFQADVLRQTFLDPPGNQPHLRKMLEDEPFALVFANHFGHRIRIHNVQPSGPFVRPPSELARRIRPKSVPQAGCW